MSAPFEKAGKKRATGSTACGKVQTGAAAFAGNLQEHIAMKRRGVVYYRQKMTHIKLDCTGQFGRDRRLKILVVDGQGGKMGGALIEQIKKSLPGHQVVAVGTNSIATSTMLKAGADAGATGENPVVVNAADADVIVGPLGIVIANSLLGEITPAMAAAIGSSPAHRVLLPVDKCSHTVVGVVSRPLSDYVRLAADEICRLTHSETAAENGGEV